MIYIEMLGINVVDLLLMILVVFARELIKTWLLWDLIHGSPIRFKPSLASIACLWRIIEILVCSLLNEVLFIVDLYGNGWSVPSMIALTISSVCLSLLITWYHLMAVVIACGDGVGDWETGLTLLDRVRFEWLIGHYDRIFVFRIDALLRIVQITSLFIEHLINFTFKFLHLLTRRLLLLLLLKLAKELPVLV